MLQKINRLQKSKEIEWVLSQGKGFKEDSLALKTAKNNLNYSRFAFLVSKKVSLKASLRNKIKRGLRERVRLSLEKIRIGADNVIVAIPGVEKEDSKTRERALDKLLEKISK